MYLTKTKYYGEVELWNTKPRYDEILDMWYDVPSNDSNDSCDIGSVYVSHIDELSKLITFENSPLRVEVNISLSQEVD